MCSTITKSLIIPLSPTCQMELRFYKTDDRYAHQWILQEENREFPLLSTFDEEIDSIWPANPPIQQLTIESRSQSKSVALGLGMAGKNHWSFSAITNFQEFSFDFELACKTDLPPKTLGNHYQIDAESFQIAETSNDRICWKNAQNDWQFSLIVDSPTKNRVDLTWNRPNRLKLSLTPEENRTSPHHIWKYRLIAQEGASL